MSLEQRVKLSFEGLRCPARHSVGVWTRRKEERWRVASHIAERRNERKSSGRATTDESYSTRQQGQQVQQAQEEPDPAHPEGIYDQVARDLHGQAPRQNVPWDP